MRRDLEGETVRAEFLSDICVIGGGIAGLILARRLARAGGDVHLLEAGGEKLEPRSQPLLDAEMRGAPHLGTTRGRHRVFGGSSTHWAGQLLPYPPETFQPRRSVGGIGWPISEADLTRYYPEILDIMGADHLAFTEDFAGANGLLTSTDQVRVRYSKWAPFARRNLARTVGAECLASDRVTLFLHAQAIELKREEGTDRVETVEVRNERGVPFRFRARIFIVASGTLETSRLLLNSTGLYVGEAAALHDRVGRYFFDHTTVDAATLGGPDLAVYRRIFAPYYQRRTFHTARMEATPHLQEELGLLSVMAHFEFEEPEHSGPALIRLFLQRLQGRSANDHETPLAAYVRGAGELARLAFDLKLRGRRLPSSQARVRLNFDVEQRPRADSRLTLSAERDAFGMSKLVVDWKQSQEELDSMQRYAGVLAPFLRVQGLMQIGWKPGLLESAEAWRDAGVDIFHPMGGARMADARDAGVVDRDLRVHGLANLFVASCAVYPTGGSSNPTFTLMALALRLADFLQTRR